MSAGLLHDRYQMQTPLSPNKPNVRKAWDRCTGRWVLIKGFLDTKQAKLEFTALHRLAGLDCVVQILDTYSVDCFGGKTEWCLVLEYIERGTMLEFIESVGSAPIHVDTLYSICSQLLNGLFQMHSQGVVHGDIKPSNILCRADGRLVYCDYGLSTVANSGLEQVRIDKCSGTPAFVAPEILELMIPDPKRRGSPKNRVSNYDGYAADVWSLGVTLFVLITGDLPFDDKTEMGMFDKIMHGRLIFPGKKTIPTDLQSLLKAMLRKDPSRRASTAELLLHSALS